MAYATLADYEARYGAVDEGAEEVVATLLEDASTILDELVPTIDVSDAHQRKLLRIVARDMVGRALDTGGAPTGVDQMSYTMGPFAQSVHVTNPHGDMYLTANERRLLGISGTTIGSIRAKVAPCHGRRHA